VRQKSSLFLNIVTGIFATRHFFMLNSKLNNGLSKAAVIVLLVIVIIVPVTHGGGYFL